MIVSTGRQARAPLFTESEARLHALGLVCTSSCVNTESVNTESVINFIYLILFIYISFLVPPAPLFAESKARLHTLGLVCKSPCVNKEIALLKMKMYILVEHSCTQLCVNEETCLWKQMIDYIRLGLQVSPLSKIKFSLC